MPSNYDFYVQPGTSGSTSGGGSTAAAPKPPQNIPKPPQYFWFRGKRYSTWSAYQGAVTAYNRQLASAAAYQNWLKNRQKALARQRLLARQRAIRSQFLARQRREFARRSAVQRAAELKRRKGERDRLAASQRTKLRAELKKRNEAELARRRHAAWADMGRRGRSLANQNFERRAALVGQRRPPAAQVMGQARVGQARARLEGRDRAAVTTKPQFQQQALADRLAGRGEVLEPHRQRVEERRRDILLAEARRTGDWQAPLDWLDSVVARTHGRYYDQVLFDRVHSEYAAYANSVATPYVAMVTQITALMNAGKATEAAKLLYSPEFERLATEYRSIVGEGRKPGSWEGLMAVSRRIADGREEYLERVYLGAYANRDLTMVEEDQIEAFRSSVGAGGLDRRIAARAPGMLDGDAKPRGNMSLRSWLDAQYDMQRRYSERMATMTLREREADQGFRRKVKGGVMFTDRGESRGPEDDQVFVRGKDGNMYRPGEEQQRDYINRLLRDPDQPESFSMNFDQLVDMAELARSGREDVRNELVTIVEQLVRNASPYNKPLSRSRTGDPGRARWNKAVNNQVESILRWLGLELPTGPGAVVDRLGRAPVAGMLLGAMNAGLGVLGANAREDAWLTTGRGGVERRPEVRETTDVGDVVGPKRRRWQLGTEDLEGNFAEGILEFTPGMMTDTSPAGKRAFAALYKRYKEMIAEADKLGFWEGMGIRQQAWSMLQGELTTGNLGILYDTLMDPLTYIAPARFINAGRLAMAEAGGVGAAVRALRAAPTRATLLGNYRRFVLPHGLGGAAPPVRARAESLLRASVETKIPYVQLKLMQPDELAEVIERAARGQTVKEIARHVEGFEKLYKKSDLNAQQLLVWAQHEFGKSGSAIPPPAALAKMVDEAVESQRRTELALETAARIELERVPRAAAAEALHIVRQERAAVDLNAPQIIGQPPARVKARTGGAQKKLNQLQAAVLQTLEAQAKVAQRAADAAKVLTSGETIDTATRLRAYDDLRTTLGLLDQYRDLPIEAAGARGSPIGIVSKRRAELKAYRTSQNVSEGVLDYASLDQLRLRGDGKWIASQLVATKQALRKATNPVVRTRLKAKLARLQAAKEGLRIEVAVSKRGAGVVQRVRRAHRAVLRETFSAVRVARVALTPQAQRAELARELHARYDQRVVEVSPTFSAAKKATLKKAESELQGRQLAWIPELEGMHEIARAVGVQNMSLAEAYELALWIRRDYVSGAGLGDAVDLIEEEVRRVLRSINVAPIEYSKWVDYGHNAKQVMDIYAYRRMDELITAEVRRLTNTQRRGALRSARRSERLPDAGPQVLRDSDPEVLLAKIRILRDKGYSLAAYDEARSAVGEISRRAKIGEELSREARRMGGDVLQNFKDLREARRLEYGEADFEQFVNEHISMGLKSELMGGGDETMLRAWVEARTLDDMRVPRRSVTAYQERVLKDSLKALGLDPDDVDGMKAFLQTENAPPFDAKNIVPIREWLVENGFWTPKTAEEIKSGARVWSVADERLFWETMYGWTPPWTDPVLLKPMLESPQRYLERMREWGFLENDFEKLSGDTGIETVRTAMDAIAFGGKGVKKARTYDELRAWFGQRFGELVMNKDGTFHSVPWMMDLPEYQGWFVKMADEAGIVVDPKTGAYPLKDFMRELGLDPTLASPEEMLAIAKAMRDMVPAHLERMKLKLADEGVTGDLWLPEERMRFAYEIVDALLTDQHWRRWHQRMPAWSRMLAVASLQRLFVVMNLAFPVMNVIDSYGPKAATVSLLRNRGRWIHSPKEHWYELFTRAEIDGTMKHTWATSDYWTRIGDARYSLKAQQRAAIAGIGDVPMKISGAAEGVLRYNTAISVAGRTYDDLIAGGMDPVAARALARLQGMNAVKTFYSVLEGAPDWLLALNQLVPFLTYQYKNSMMGLRILYEMPWIFQIGQRLGEGIREWNRERWRRIHGSDVPFNEDDPQMSQIWFESPVTNPDGSKTMYSIDLSMFSDWTRAITSLTDENRDFYTNFIRVPHPIQTAIFGMLWEGQTSWGEKADWTQLNSWFELFNHLSDPAPYETINPKSLDLAQWISKMLFFKPFGRVDPIKARVQEFFGIMNQDEDLGWEFYNQYPELRAYFAINGIDIKPFKMRKVNWFSMASQQQIDAYDEAYAGWTELNDMWDKKLGQYFLDPTSREARELKKLRQAALQQYLRSHPVLADAWTFSTDDREFAELQEDFKVDLEVEDFFSIKPPKRASFDTDLAYAQAQLAYLNQRTLFLEQHPAVAVRLQQGNSAIERAWFERELQWTEILKTQAAIKIKIATEEAKANPDRDLLSFLYDLGDENYVRLDAESFGQFYDFLGPEIERRKGRREGRALEFVSSAMGRVREFAKLPGRSDYFYEIASDQERVEIVETEKYHSALGGMMEELKAKGDFSTFWTELKDRGLLARYLKENPGKVVDYNFNVNISRIFNKGGWQKFWDNLIAEPYWLQQYLNRPSQDKTIAEKRATYQRVLVGKRYFGAMQELWSVIGDDASRFYDELAKRPWLQAEYFRRHPEKAGMGGGMSAYGIAISAIFKRSKNGKDFMTLLAQNPALQAEYFRRHPEAAAKFAAGREYFNWMQRWIRAIESSDHSAAGKVWDAMPDWVHEKYFAKHPEKRAKFVQNSAYSAALGGWIDLLKADKNQEADAYFRALPDWVKERYYAKHPDQRAKNDLSNEMLALGAEYFLAESEDLKLSVLRRNPQFAAWLREHGGKEGEMRGLIFAIYRAIPSSDAWLKRKFRDAYPEIFSAEGKGERMLAGIRRRLAEHPEMRPFYEKALAIQQLDYTEQLRRNKAQPPQLNYERKKRLRKRQKRRAARINSRWRHFMALR